MKKFFFVTLLLVCFTMSYGNTKIDSLKKIINTSMVDSVKLNAIFELADIFTNINLDSANKYISDYYSKIDTVNDIKNLARYYMILGRNYVKSFNLDKSSQHLYKSLKLFKLINDKNNIPIILNLIGNYWEVSIQYDSAIFYYQKSLENLDTINQNWLIAADYNNMANSYNAAGNNILALNYYIKALKLFKQLDKEENEAVTLGNIGAIYRENKHFENAIKYLTEAIELNKKNNCLSGLCTNYNVLGLTYRYMDNYDKAIYYFKEACKISENSNFIYSIAQSYHNLGTVYILTGDYDKAEYYIDKSLKISEEMSITIGLMMNYYNKRKIYIHNKNFEKAEEYLLKGLKLSTNDYSYEAEANEKLKEVFKETHNYKKALEYLEKYVVLNDSVEKRKRSKEFEEIKTKYETEQKEIDNKLLIEKTLNQELIINRQKIVVLLFIIIIITTIFVIILLIISRKKRKEHVNMLKAKNILINKKTKELNESNKTKDKLFSIISHDLRTPFTGLLGFSSMLQQDINDGQTENIAYYSNQIFNSTQSTYELIENLLTWSKSQQNKIKPFPIIINLNGIVEEIVSPMIPKINNKKITIKNNINNQQTIICDHNILMIITRNLINNAIKFTPAGGCINIDYYNDKNSHVISINDNGVGFDENIRKKLLSGDNYTTKGTDNEIGSGLGLLLIKDLLKYINGKLAIISKQGKGSTFSIILPNIK